VHIPRNKRFHFPWLLKLNTKGNLLPGNKLQQVGHLLLGQAGLKTHGHDRLT
jgi:hypothetical protein